MQTYRRDPQPRGGGSDNARKHRTPGALEGDPIVDELRKLYDGIVDEPVPDHLTDLLRQLDEVERKR